MRSGAAICGGAWPSWMRRAPNGRTGETPGPPCVAASAIAHPARDLGGDPGGDGARPVGRLLGDPVGADAVADLGQRGRGGGDDAAQPDEQIAGVVRQRLDHRIIVGLRARTRS